MQLFGGLKLIKMVDEIKEKEVKKYMCAECGILYHRDLIHTCSKAYILCKNCNKMYDKYGTKTNK